MMIPWRITYYKSFVVSDPNSVYKVLGIPVPVVISQTIIPEFFNTPRNKSSLHFNPDPDKNLPQSLCLPTLYTSLQELAEVSSQHLCTELFAYTN
jgi:hypothetical protein